MTDLNKDLLRGAKAIAAFLGFKDTTAGNMIRRGTIPTFKMGNYIYARKSTLLKWIEALEQKGASASNDQ